MDLRPKRVAGSEKSMPLERLQKIMSRKGICSRREAEVRIAAGRVKVNGEVVTELGTKVDPAKDQIEVDGAPVAGKPRRITLVLNKPEGYVSTVKDRHAERTVMELIEGVEERVYPIGRLDVNTKGVLLFTNDGELANALLHPSTKIKKIYEVVALGRLTSEQFDQLESGVELEDGMTSPAEIFGVKRYANSTRFKMSIYEGRKRQIRMMLRALDSRVMALTRISFAGIKVGPLAEGEWRFLLANEVSKLKKTVQYAQARKEEGRAPARKAPTRREFQDETPTDKAPARAPRKMSDRASGKISDRTSRKAPGRASGKLSGKSTAANKRRSESK